MRQIGGMVWIVVGYLVMGGIQIADAEPLDIGALTSELQPYVEELRGLPFLQTVEKTFQSPQELQEVLLTEIERTYPGDTLQAIEKRLLKFGFIVSPIDLRQMLTHLFTQEIAGYYDPRSQKMVLIQTQDSSGTREVLFPIEHFSKVLIQGMGYSMEKILLTHELTHVLQDQHFQLLTLPFEDLDPEDRTSAVRALVEGDATLVMLDYVLQQQGTDAVQTPEVSATMRIWANSLFVRGLGMFQTIPRYILDNLLFGYIYGFDFVLHVKRQGGWELVNQAYRDFPVSTEQILHPEKYTGPRDVPTTIKLPPLPESFSGWRELESNTLGELNIMILLDGFLLDTEAERASTGWDGDRFTLYENADTQALLLAWYTTWDTAEDATEYFETYLRMLQKRYIQPVVSEQTTPDRLGQNPFVWQTEHGTVYLERRDTDVLLLDGVPDHLLAETIQRFWTSTKHE